MTRAIAMNIDLSESLQAFVALRVQAGGYGSASEYIAELLLKDQEACRRRSLRALLDEGIASGPATPFTSGEWDELEALVQGPPPHSQD